MLIKINTNESLDSQIEDLKNHFDVRTASRACSLAAASFIGTNNLLDIALVKVEELEEKLSIIKNAIHQQEHADMVINQALRGSINAEHAAKR